MKRCPSCRQTYADDAPDYCSNDGMRLLNEEAAPYDPEMTMLAVGLRGGDLVSPPPQPAVQQHHQTPNAAPAVQPPTPWQSASEQPQQPWNAPPGDQSAQPVWPPPAQNWGGVPYQQPAANVPYAAPYAATQVGRSRALSIAGLVTGACAVTIMSLLVVNTRDFTFTSMLILAILGIVLGVTSLIMALQKPSRFGGVPLAIAGLATGTAALVYYFTL